MLCGGVDVPTTLMPPPPLVVATSSEGDSRLPAHREGEWQRCAPRDVSRCGRKLFVPNSSLRCRSDSDSDLGFHGLGQSLGCSIRDYGRRFWAVSSRFGIRVCGLRFREKTQTLNPQVKAQGLHAHLRAEATNNLYYMGLSEN